MTDAKVNSAMQAAAAKDTPGGESGITRILRASERVFAEHGYHGATMRQVANAADVSLALLVYHFGNKQNLYYAIFANRQYLNVRRLELLRKIDVGAPDALEQIVEAFISPWLSILDGSDGRWFARLAFREASDPSHNERAVVRELFDPMAGEFITTLRRALPDKPAGFCETAYLFAVGALTQTVMTERLTALGGDPSPETIHNHLRDFITSALRG